MTEPLTPEQADMVANNMGLVYRHANRLPDHLRDDAVQDAVFGLARAAQKYDPSRGFTFATYADNWIRQAIQRGRGNFEGIDWRRATQSGDPLPAPPARLDMVIGDGDAELGLLAVMTTDDDVTDEIDGQLLVEQIEHHLCAHAGQLSDTDRVVLAEMLWWDRSSARTLAERLGVSRQAVESRRRKLCGLIRRTGALENR